jgi:hypothetical protein
MMFAAGYFFSCTDMDNTYKEFLVPNGLTYPQKPDSLKVHAGYNRLRLTWLKAKDPSIERAEIYWNNYLDTLKINSIPAGDTVVVDIPVADENTYTFYVKTFDTDGNASIPSEVSGAAYGENYVVGTADRTVESALRDDNYNGTVTWSSRTTDLAYSEVRYTSSSNETRIVRALPGEMTSNCPNAKPGTLIEYRSVFLPPKGVDYVEKEWTVYETSFFYKYPRTEWTAAAKGGNHNWGDGGGGQPALIFDGNIATGWHSNTGSPLPQCMVVDMKQPLSVHHLIMYPPGNAAWRYWNNIEIYLSDTPITPAAPDASWGEPAARVQYTGGADFTVNFPSVPSCQYIAIVFVNSKTNTYINLMEFEVFGY